MWSWLAVVTYACAVTFPHQLVQDWVGQLARRITLRHVYQGSVAIALLEAVVLTVLFAKRVHRQKNRGLLALFWLLSFALIVGTWGLLTANNTELVHYPQYFPEGVALLALTLSPVEAMAWVAIFGGLDEAFQYTFLVAGRPLPYDFNDVYMDLVGGAAGVIFAIAVLGFTSRARRTSFTGIFKKPGIVALLGIVATGVALWASGKMLLYEGEGGSGHWFSLSRLKTPTFWYFSPQILGPHHFHELSPVEGTALILATIALYGVLDRIGVISTGAQAEKSNEVTLAARTGRQRD